MTLCKIIAGKNKPCKIIEIIKNFYPVPDEMKNIFLGREPVYYEQNDGAIFTTEKNNIIYCDIKNAAAKIGNFYKVPNEYITHII